MNNQSETREKRLGPRLAAIVIGVLLLAALIYVQQRERTEEAAGPPAVPVPAPAPTQGAGPKAADDPGARARGDRARAIIAELRSGESERDLDAIFARATAFHEAGREADAYLLYFYGAREGDPAAALMLGRIYDPTGPDELNAMVDVPIPGQAYKWYRTAADNGSEVAEDYLANLRGWTEDAAARGDPEARRLLMIWK